MSKISAWIVTWDWSGEHAAMDRPEILAFFPADTDISFIRQFVENLYAEKTFTLDERVRWTANPDANPYRATVTRVHVHCGHNPMLFARVVDDLEMMKEESGKIVGAWVERELGPSP
jgi:hypothetical protein